MIYALTLSALIWCALSWRARRAATRARNARVKLWIDRFGGDL